MIDILLKHLRSAVGAKEIFPLYKSREHLYKSNA